MPRRLASAVRVVRRRLAEVIAPPADPPAEAEVELTVLTTEDFKDPPPREWFAERDQPVRECLPVIPAFKAAKGCWDIARAEEPS